MKFLENNIIFTNLISLLIGGIITWIITKKGLLLSRKEKIFERSLSELFQIWSAFNVLKFEFHNIISLGYEKWRQSDHYEKSCKLLDEFRSKVDNAQIILDDKIIEGFRKLDTYYFECAKSNNKIDPDEFKKKIESYLNELTDIINEYLNNINLRLRL